MAVTNASAQDITADTLLSQSKPKIKDNFDDLLENDVAIEARITSLEALISGVVEYSDNAAVKAAGLTNGKLYRTADVLKIVHS